MHTERTLVGDTAHNGCKQCEDAESSPLQKFCSLSNRLVSQASSAKGDACGISEQFRSQNSIRCCMAQSAETVDVYACGSLSRSIIFAHDLRACEVQNFPGTYPYADPPSCYLLTHALVS